MTEEYIQALLNSLDGSKEISGYLIDEVFPCSFRPVMVIFRWAGERTFH